MKQIFTASDGTVCEYTYRDANELREGQIPGVGSITIPAYTWNRPATINFPDGIQRPDRDDVLLRFARLTARKPESRFFLSLLVFAAQGTLLNFFFGVSGEADQHIRRSPPASSPFHLCPSDSDPPTLVFKGFQMRINRFENKFLR